MAPLETPGAEYTTSSNTMAILLPSRNALPVISSQIRAPFPFICMETAGAPSWSYVCAASTITLPLRGGSLDLFALTTYKSTKSVLALGIPHKNLVKRKSAGSNARTSERLRYSSKMGWSFASTCNSTGPPA